jgi:hypothetical protein
MPSPDIWIGGPHKISARFYVTRLRRSNHRCFQRRHLLSFALWASFAVFDGVIYWLRQCHLPFGRHSLSATASFFFDNQFAESQFVIRNSQFLNLGFETRNS